MRRMGRAAWPLATKRRNNVTLCRPIDSIPQQTHVCQAWEKLETRRFQLQGAATRLWKATNQRDPLDPNSAAPKLGRKAAKRQARSSSRRRIRERRVARTYGHIRGATRVAVARPDISLRGNERRRREAES